MKCKNCGNDNPEGAERCEQCGKPPGQGKFDIYLNQIIIGSVIGLLIVLCVYSIWGMNFAIPGLFAAVVISGFITTVISYNKDYKVAYDNNPTVQSLIVGLIVSSIALTGISSVDSSFSALMVLIPGFGLICGFMGSLLGIIANSLRQNKPKFLIPYIIAIILLFPGVIYAYNYIEPVSDQFEVAFSNEMTYLSYNDLIQVEADSYLNKTSENLTGRKSNLKEAQIRYNRMIQLSTEAFQWNKVMLASSSSDVQEEYSNALGKYIDIQLQYYNLTETGIELELEGETTQAQKYYEKAQNLTPQINIQKKLLTTIAEKDSNFQKFLEKEILQSKKYAEYKKNELLTIPTAPPG